MLSFTDLPPEIRLAIYKHPLQSTLEKTTRILYSGNDPLRCGDTPHCIRHNQPFERTCPEGCVSFLDARIIYARDIQRAKYNIHHADNDDLIFLAATCRLLRADLLALIWSRADIHVMSPELHNELRWIFHDRLASESCNFIRTLLIDVREQDWLPSETRKIVGLIRRRLPNLEKLTVNVCMNFAQHKELLAPGLAAFRILPLHVKLELNHRVFFHHAVPISGGAGYEIETLQSLRTELSLIAQKRGRKQAKWKLEDQVCDILEDTIEMRALMVGCTVRIY